MSMERRRIDKNKRQQKRVPQLCKAYVTKKAIGDHSTVACRSTVARKWELYCKL